VGIIIKQTIRGSIWSYAGVLLGFLNLAILSPKIFSAEEIGLTQVLIAISTILAQFSGLGFQDVTNRLFPFFRNNKQHHNGYLFLAMAVSATGFILVSIFLYFFTPYLVTQNLDKSPLLSEYAFYVWPLVFFFLYFAVFDNYNKVLYNIVLGTFLKDFLLRLLNLGIILLYYFDVIDFARYVLLFVIIQSVPPLVLSLYLIRHKKFNLRPQLHFITPELKKQILLLCVFGIISGLSSFALINIDKYMVNAYIDLKAAGIYSVTFYFGTLIMIPSRVMNKAVVPIISESWKANNMAKIDDVLVKSSINQFLFGLLLFAGIWGNLHNIFRILPENYENGQWVIFFISMANLITVSTGSSIMVLNTSHYYRFQAYFMFLLITLVVISNILLIPVLGITGAALASMISTLIYSAVRLIFLKIKFGLWPWKLQHLSGIAIAVISYGAGTLIPSISNLVADILVRSLVILVVYIVLVYFLKLSTDFNHIINKQLGKSRE